MKEEIFKQKSKEVYDMEQLVKHIIQCENREYDEFMNYQEKRISELKELQRRKEKGEDVDISGILQSLRRSGILDSNNNVAEPYTVVFGK